MTSAVVSSLASSSFHSVKLPAPLVSDARTAALTFRRSTAGQIEYWAMLGKAVEESGITVREVQAVMEPAASALPSQANSSQAQSLMADFIAFDRSGALAAHVRQVVASNAAKASANNAQRLAA